MVLFWRFWAQEKYPSLFGGHLSAKEFLEAHHNFVGGHGSFPERFLCLDHATTVIQSTNDTLVKIEHGEIFWRSALTEAGRQEGPAVPQRMREGHPRSSQGLQLKLGARPHDTRTKSKAAGKSARSTQAGSKAARERF
jgi:hypothetical protein